jgi:hypothetical protein
MTNGERQQSAAAPVRTFIRIAADEMIAPGRLRKCLRLRCHLRSPKKRVAIRGMRAGNKRR